MAAWALKDFEASPSRVYSQVRDGEPQLLTSRGVPSYVIITYTDYEAWRPKQAEQEKGDLDDVLRSGSEETSGTIAGCSKDAGAKPSQLRVPGLLKGRIQMADDFDDWPDDIAQSLGMR